MAFTNHKETPYRVQSLQRALDILDCFTFENREMSLSDLVKRTRLNKTTAKRLISNLTDRGYLQQDPETKRYQLGLRLFELGGIIFSSFSLRKAAGYPMTHLQNATGATVLLGVNMDDQLVYVDKREGHGMLRIASDIGWRRPLHYGMLGMILMAYLSPKDVKKILRQYPLGAHTRFSITDQEVFRLRLEKIRKEGYVIEREEAVEKVIGIAAPIRDYSRRVIAALGIALTSGQVNLEKEAGETEGIRNLLLKACDDISGELGYLKI